MKNLNHTNLKSFKELNVKLTGNMLPAGAEKSDAVALVEIEGGKYQLAQGAGK